MALQVLEVAKKRVVLQVACGLSVDWWYMAYKAYKVNKAY